MKRHFFLFFVFVHLAPVIFGCDCVTSSISFEEKIKGADFIAIVKITDAPYYDWNTLKKVGEGDVAYFKLIELFKGDSLNKVQLNSIGTSCDPGVLAGEEWIVFSSKDNRGVISIDMCSESEQFRNADYSITKKQPFFESKIYLLRNYFGHPQPKLNEGLTVEKYYDEGITEVYNVKNGKLNGFYNWGNIKFYSFKDGELNGYTYQYSTYHGSKISRYYYTNGNIKSVESYDASQVDADRIDSNFFICFSSNRFPLLIRRFYIQNNEYYQEEFDENRIVKIISGETYKQSKLITEYFLSGKVKRVYNKLPDGNGYIEIEYYESGFFKRIVEMEIDVKRKIQHFNEKGELIKEEIISLKK